MKTTLGAFAAGLVAFAAGPGIVHAEKSGDWQQWIPMECGHALNASAAEGSHCFQRHFDETLMGYAAEFLDTHGKTVFGDNFGFHHRLSLSPAGTGASRNIDAVFPLHFRSGDAGPGFEKTALFLQQGITRWHDNAGFTRNDFRHGVAYRFALSEDRENILGISAIYQENMERGHSRLVATLDYNGRFGTGRIQHFLPTSSWKPGRTGYEERALGGTEIGASLGITQTLSLDTALTRWNDETETAKDIHSRVGVGFRPHPWLNVRAGYETGFAEDAANIHVQLTIPLGGAPKSIPRWEGVGSFGMAQTGASIWQPVENVEQLQTVERIITPTVQAQANGITVSFIQDSAQTGSEIGLRLSIPAPLPDDLRLVVQLVPGSGTNPAIPGEDFTDTPRSVTIAKGETSASVYFQLLHNAEMQENRGLAVSVSLDDSA